MAAFKAEEERLAAESAAEQAKIKAEAEEAARVVRERVEAEAKARRAAVHCDFVRLHGRTWRDWKEWRAAAAGRGFVAPATRGDARERGAPWVSVPQVPRLRQPAGDRRGRSRRAISWRAGPELDLAAACPPPPAKRAPFQSRRERTPARATIRGPAAARRCDPTPNRLVHPPTRRRQCRPTRHTSVRSHPRPLLPPPTPRPCELPPCPSSSHTRRVRASPLGGG